MKKVNLISENTTVSLFKNYQSTTPIDVNLWGWLRDTTYKAEIEYLRTLENKDDKRKIKSGLPAITPSGVFLIRNEAGLLQPSGFICIDIDAADNPEIQDFEYLRDQLTHIVNVAYCGLSASGRGVFCLIPIKCPDKHKMHFEALKSAFEKLGIMVDKGCGDVTRLRGCSYDPKGHFNMNAVTFNQLYDRNDKPTNSLIIKRKPRFESELNSQLKAEKVVSNIVATGTDITGDYNQWFQIGCALANEFGEDGREMFHTVSSFSDKYKVAATDSQFNKCLEGNYDYNIGTFFHWAEENNMI